MGELGPISSGHQAIGRVHPGQVTSPSQGSIETQSAVNHANTLIPQDNLERPKNLTVMLLDCGRKLEYLDRTHACTGRTCRKSSGGDSNPGAACCKVLPSVPLCSPQKQQEEMSCTLMFRTSWLGLLRYEICT
ncbi:hypothetical protein AMECASPLE_000853 [Ameca splendens]|uniref:Uncharacterized protein n=1 Tax=Ameca splendens TaxID=208324 RepID=A0ABV0YVW0_9TELE